MRIVALADSDSYVKWGAALIGSLPPEWERELLVVDSQFTVNDAQLRTALRGTGVEKVRRVAYREVDAVLRERTPDAVLVAAPGPVSQVLIRLVAECTPRPVIVSGLPGISIPVTVKALRFRLQSDLMVVHSHREVREFGELSRQKGWDHRLGLARLPFAGGRAAAGSDLVFAAQAIVPRSREDRLVVAGMLRDAALADPSRRVVVKLRALPGERSTHPEDHPYPELLDELGERPANLVFRSGSMDAVLDEAAGLVTVSSTALLEALGRGIPCLAIDTFGVSAKLINEVFVGSGLLADRSAVVAREVRHPDAGWLDDNYFHRAADDDWARILETLLAERRAGRLEVRSPHRAPGGRLRAAWDRKMALGAADRSLAGYVALVAGIPARALLRRARRARAWLSLRTSAG